MCIRDRNMKSYASDNLVVDSLILSSIEGSSMGENSIIPAAAESLSDSFSAEFHASFDSWSDSQMLPASP